PEHVLLEVFEMSRHLEQPLTHDVRREDQIVPVTKNQRTLVLLDFVADDRTLGMPENQSGADAWIRGVKVQQLRQHAMVSPLRFLQSMELLLEILLLPK